MTMEEEIGRFDWSRLRTYAGHAETVPGTVRELATAADEDEAGRLGARIEHILLSVAGPCEACAPAATVLVAALPGMTPAGRSAALEVLAQIGATEVTGPGHEQIGAVDAEQIRRAVAAGLPHYLAVLRSPSATEPDVSSCIEILDVVAFGDPGLAPAAVAALEGLRAEGRHPDLGPLIDTTVSDLTGSLKD
jgi:hypothetical protein